MNYRSSPSVLFECGYRWWPCWYSSDDTSRSFVGNSIETNNNSELFLLKAYWNNITDVLTKHTQSIRGNSIWYITPRTNNRLSRFWREFIEKNNTRKVFFRPAANYFCAKILRARGIWQNVLDNPFNRENVLNKKYFLFCLHKWIIYFRVCRMGSSGNYLFYGSVCFFI